MSPRHFLIQVLDPGLTFLSIATGQAADDRARVLMLAIAGQESDCQHRLQFGGPARGFWQFERGGGVRGVLTHPASAPRIQLMCDAMCIPMDEATVSEAIAWSDDLAVAMARLLLWTDPAALPAVGNQDASWRYYLRTWRPGKPRPTDWPLHYDAALQAIQPGS